MANRRVGKMHTPGDEEGAAGDVNRVGPFACESCEGRIDLSDARRLVKLDLQSYGARGAFQISVVLAAAGLFGLLSTATRTAAGTSSCRSSSRFVFNSELKKLIPVRFPPGRARLATRPILTGSSLTAKTMGITVVAAFATCGAEPVVATIMATRRRTRSAAISSSRPGSFSAKRYTIATFSPST